MAGYALGTDEGSAVVKRMGEINVEGNIIPHTWYDHLRYPSGKPHLNAIIILSEIVYWYRPVAVKDERTGRLLGQRKKFEGEWLQRTRGSFSDQFGLTKKQAKDAFNFLEDKGVIRILVKKSIKLPNGKKLGNVPYIALNPEKVHEFNEPLVPVGPRLGTCRSEPLVPTSPTNTETTITETLNTERKDSHVEKSNVDFSRGTPSETPQQSSLLPLDNPSKPPANTNGSQQGKRERAKKQANPNTKPILDAYKAAYEKENGFPYTFPGSDTKAAKVLADAGYTPEQVVAAYEYLCKDEWWKEQGSISLLSISRNMGGILKKCSHKLPSNGKPKIGQSFTDESGRTLRLNEKGVLEMFQPSSGWGKVTNQATIQRYAAGD